MNAPVFKVGDRVWCFTNERFGTIAKVSFYQTDYVIDWEGDETCSELPGIELGLAS